MTEGHFIVANKFECQSNDQAADRILPDQSLTSVIGEIN